MQFNANTLRKFINFAQRAFKLYQDVQQDAPRSSGQKTPPSPASTRGRTAPSTPSVKSGSYPGDYRGKVTFTYAPENDGQPDPGEIVWGWVPYEEDYSQGKDRPVLIVGKSGQYYLGLMLTSKDHTNSYHRDQRYLDIGSGSWDRSGRASEVRLDRVIQLDAQKIRREGAVVDELTFNRIKDAFQNYR